MQTPTHLLVASALLARPATTPAEKWRNAAILFGALLPDLSIFVLFAWARFYLGASEETLWSELYWQEPWQSLGAISNSIPLFIALTAIGFALSRSWLWGLGIAGLAHLALDFPLHHDDAHIHFWPFSDWRFHSPLSYWDTDHYGAYVSGFELALGIVLTILLMRRFKSKPVRALLLSSLSLYVLVPLYFSIML